ncbi:cytidylyltransferase [bacterium]|nr:cytidylyltransferase [bacterium]|tara:strand:+ start:10692 stop:11345 length:654 start_codon:yes stop_codon:yes gene_type:complete
MPKKIKALIPVRSGSVRVLNKNIRPFAGSSLLELKVKQLLKIPSLDGVVVNSNSDEMLDVARGLGVETIKREEKYATSEVSMNDVYENMAENMDCDFILYINCTNPLIRTKTIEDMLQTDFKEHDSINSAHLIKENLWKDGEPINYDPSCHPRSQDLPDIFALNFATSLISRDNMIVYKNVVGKNPLMYNISEEEGLDIDNLIDFKIAEFLFTSREN